MTLRRLAALGLAALGGSLGAAVVGLLNVFGGAVDRCLDHGGRVLEAAAVCELAPGQVVPLGPDHTIRSVVATGMFALLVALPFFLLAWRLARRPSQAAI